LPHARRRARTRYSRAGWGTRGDSPRFPETYAPRSVDSKQISGAAALGAGLPNSDAQGSSNTA
jgi:hypothetical protein